MKPNYNVLSRCSTFVYFETYLLYSILDYGRHSVEKLLHGRVMHLNYVQLGSLGVKQQGKERKLFQMLIAYVLNNHDHESLYNGYLKTFTILHVPSEVNKCFNPFTPKISFVILISFCLIIYDVSLENLEWINQ